MGVCDSSKKEKNYDLNMESRTNRIASIKKISSYKNLNSFQIDYNNLIGKGAFGKVYLGKIKKTGKEVAVKIEPKNSNYSYISNEIKIFEKLKGGFGIPKIYWSGNNKNNYILIMEKLGPSLQKVFYHYNQKFSLSMIKNIGIKILNILEFIHKKDIIHGDIKPGCFLIDNYKDFNIYILDFGFSREINKITGLPLESKSSFIGDFTYASKNLFLGLPASKRDDIISLGYMLIYFLKGSLPWGISKNYINIKQIKLSTSIDSLCYGLPIEIKEFIDHAYNLKTNENPDYYYLSNILNKCGETIDNIKTNKFNLFESKENPKTNIASTESPLNSIVVSKNEPDVFSQIKSNEFDKNSLENSIGLDNEDLKSIETGYLQNKNSYKINAILRTLGPKGLDEEQIKIYNALTKAININRIKANTLVHRFVGNDYLKNVFKFTPSNISYDLSMIRQQIGTIKIEKGFMSCFMTENHIIERNIILEIKIPKGTRAYISRNKIESEIILPCNTKYQVMDAKISNNIIQIDIDILNEDENNDDLFSNLKQSKPN